MASLSAAPWRWWPRCWRGFQPFLLVVMGIVWWATHKLTFDCTLLDEDQDAGVGLLQESGLDPSALADAGDTDSTARSNDDPEAMDTSLMPDRPWWKVWGSDSGEARRPHAPGVWLIYFAIASLPLFGLGQWLVPAVEEDRRAWLSWYFLAYIASAMGLLLATSFLNLRRYLRRRKLKMPAAMTATWLTTGAIMIVGLTAAAAVLPVPLASLRTSRGSARESSDLRASNSAVLKDSGVQGEGAQSEGPAASKAQGKPASIGQGQGLGEDQRSQRHPADQRPGEARAAAGGQGRSKSGAAKGKPAASQNGQQGKKGAPQDQAGRKRPRAATRPAIRPRADRPRARTDDPRTSRRRASRKGDEKGSEEDSKKSSEENQDQGDSSSQPPKLPSPLPALDWLRTPIMVAGITIADLRPVPLRRRPSSGPPRLDRRRCWAGWGSAGEEASRRPRTRPPRQSRRRGRSPHTATRSTPGWIISSRPMTWSSTASRRSKPGRTSTTWPVRPTRRRWSSSTGSGEARADLGPDATRLVGYFVDDRLRPAGLPVGSPAAAPPVLAGARGPRRSGPRRAGYGAVTSMMWTHFSSDSMVTGEVVGNRQ